MPVDMTLRDWFAGWVLASAMAGATTDYPFAADAGDGTETPEAIVAGCCYRLADAMLAERAKAEPKGKHAPVGLGTNERRVRCPKRKRGS